MPTITGNNPRYKHKSEADKLATVELVAKLDRRGYSHSEIALEVFRERGINVSPQMIGRYIKEIKEEYKNATVQQRFEMVREVKAQYYDVLSAAWKRFDETGENHYLRTVKDVLDQLCRLEGLVEPDKKTFNTMIGVNTAEGNFSWDVLIQEVANRNNVLEVESQPVVFEGNTDQQALPEPSTNESQHNGTVD